MNFGLCYGTYKSSSLQRRTQEIENRHKNPAKICILGAACCFLPLMGTCSTRFTPLFVCPSLLASSTARTFRMRLWLRNAGDELERRAGAPRGLAAEPNRHAAAAATEPAGGGSDGSGRGILAVAALDLDGRPLVASGGHDGIIRLWRSVAAPPPPVRFLRKLPALPRRRPPDTCRKRLPSVHPSLPRRPAATASRAAASSVPRRRTVRYGWRRPGPCTDTPARSSPWPPPPRPSHPRPGAPAGRRQAS